MFKLFGLISGFFPKLLVCALATSIIFSLIQTYRFNSARGKLQTCVMQIKVFETQIQSLKREGDTYTDTQQRVANLSQGILDLALKQNDSIEAPKSNDCEVLRKWGVNQAKDFK